MSHNVNLDHLEPEQILSLKKDLDQREVKARADLVKKVHGEVKAHIEASGLTLFDVFGIKEAKAKKEIPAKYRNPDNPEQTWTGRGKQPSWFNQNTAILIAQPSVAQGE